MSVFESLCFLDSFAHRQGKIHKKKMIRCDFRISVMSMFTYFSPMKLQQMKLV